MGYYDATTDMIVSKPIYAERPVDDINLSFTMTRLNALLKLSFKNLELAEGDKVASVTFACEQPLAGRISCSTEDLDGVTYPIPYTMIAGTESNSITLTCKDYNDYYLSTLPSDLKLTAGDITAVTVNMSGITPIPKN